MNFLPQKRSNTKRSCPGNQKNIIKREIKPGEKLNET